MSREILRDRERALEYEFFHKVDLQLMEKLRDKIAKEELAKALSSGTGVDDQAVLDELVDLGFRNESILALSLYPLVRVAWADGSIADKERDAVLKAAAEAGQGPESVSYHLLEAWLKKEPGDEFKTAWRDYVAALCKSISPAAASALKSSLLKQSRTVAEAAGGILGLHTVSSAEEAVLTELEVVFDEAIVGAAGD